MKNVKEITKSVNGKDWEKAIDAAFNKKKKDIKIDGFRKGAVTKEVFIKKVGIEALFMDAADIAIEDAYKEAIKETDLDLACEPGVSIESIDKDGVTYKFTFIGRPEIKLGKYTKLGIKKEEVKVSADEVKHEIEHIVEHMCEVVTKEDGKVETGNTAVIDFEGTMDGKKFDGGTSENYPLEIGSNTFIPGFEEALIGMKTGETKDVNLTFPEDYVKDMAGKDVTFKVTIKEIKERVKPEMNKEFFEDLGIEGVTDEKTLKDHVKHDLEHRKEHQVEDKYIDELLKTATENMEVEINNEIIDAEVERMLNQYSQELRMQGISIEQYMQITGQKIDDMKTMMKPQAIARLKTRYLLEEIVKKEKITATKEEIKEEINKSCTQYNVSEEEFLKAVGGEDMIKYDVEMKKAVEIIKEG